MVRNLDSGSAHLVGQHQRALLLMGITGRRAGDAVTDFEIFVKESGRSECAGWRGRGYFSKFDVTDFRYVCHKTDWTCKMLKIIDFYENRDFSWCAPFA